MNIGHNELAKVCEVSPEGLRKWVIEGLPKAGRGVYDLEQAIAWVRRNKALRGLDSGLTEERTELLRVQRALKSLDLAVKKGELIPRNEILQGFLDRIAAVKSGLMTLHQRLPGMLVGKDGHEMAGVIKEEAYALLKAYSSPPSGTLKKIINEGR